MVAGSCLAQRNTEQGNFTIVGNGGLPETPLDAIVLPYELVQVQPVGSHDEQAATRLSSHYKPATPPTWKLGSAIHPAGALVVTADGRTLLVEALPSDAVANPQDLTCQLHQPQSLTATN